MTWSKNSIAIPPGETIREQLDNRRMIQKEFALRMDMSEKHISHLINGKVELTKDVALRLESVFGIPASFWNNLESIYREQLARVNAEIDVERDEEIARKIPYAKISSLGWVAPTKNIREKVLNLRTFFEIAKLINLDDLKIPCIAYKTAGSSKTSDYAFMSWIQKARLDARKINTKSINVKKLKESLPDIKALTFKDPNVFCDELRALLAECGIVIVFLPHIGGSFLHGASFVDSGRIVLGLTVGGKYADKFWFSLFHELYHIIEDHIRKSCGTSDEEEVSADVFAREMLISHEGYRGFIDAKDLNREVIVDFGSKPE